MARKSTVAIAAAPSWVRRRGRPPLAPRTTLAKWLQDRNRTTVEFAGFLAEIAPKVGLTPEDAPQPKTLLDAVNGRHWPSLPTVLLVRHATDGDVDVEHWVRDLHCYPLVSGERAAANALAERVRSI